MSPSDLRAWKERLSLTWAQAALDTKIPQSTLRAYADGTLAIPEHKALLFELLEKEMLTKPRDRKREASQ